LYSSSKIAEYDDENEDEESHALCEELLGKFL